MQRRWWAIALVAVTAVALAGCTDDGAAGLVEERRAVDAVAPRPVDPVEALVRHAADGAAFGIVASDTQETSTPGVRSGWALGAWLEDGLRCHGLATVVVAGRAQTSSGCDDRELGTSISRRFVGQGLTATVWEVGPEVTGVLITFEDGTSQIRPVTDVGGGHWVVVPRTDVDHGEPVTAERSP